MNKGRTMKKDLIKESIAYIAGKPAEVLVDLLDGNKHTNEFLIAKKLGITINQTRNILYKISEHGLVSSTRKKDKKKGWYTYSWKLEELKALEFLKEVAMKRIAQLNNQIQNRETKEFYVCERCNIEFNEENALLHDFTCLECGNVMQRKDNSKVLRAFKRNVDELNRKLEEINLEISKEKEKIIKRRPVAKSKKTKKKTAKKKIAGKKVKKKTVKKTSKKAKTKTARKVAKKTSKKKIAKKKTAKKAVKKKIKKSTKTKRVGK
jgi:transcription factor E